MGYEFLVALSTSIDALVIGISYGLRKINMTKGIILQINLISTVVIGVSMLMGHSVLYFMSDALARFISSGAIFLLGALFFIQAFIKYKFPQDSGDGRYIGRVNIEFLGIIIEILRQPEKADFDRSKTIDAKEALFLGTAISLDGGAVGFASSMSGVNIPITMVLCFILNLVCIFVGLNLGGLCCRHNIREKVPFLPGIILMAFGILKLL